MANCTEVLAEFALRQKIESLPGSVLEKSKLLILDGGGLALAAARMFRANPRSSSLAGSGAYRVGPSLRSFQTDSLCNKIKS